MVRKTIWALAAVVAGMQGAWAGRPLQTEDAAVLERAACEIESASARLRGAGEPARDQAFGLGCGVGWASQLGAASSRASSAGDGGVAAASFGGKTGLWSAADDGPALTLAWGAGSERGADNRWVQVERFAALVATLPAGPGSVHVNLSHTQERQTGRRLTGWNLAYEHAALALPGGLALAPMAEVLGDDRGDAWANLALRATLVQERLFIDASWGRQLRAERATLATVGIKLAF